MSSNSPACIFLISISFYWSDPPGCGRPHRAAGDIRPVSAPRRAVTHCAWWSSSLPSPPPIITASRRLFNCLAAAVIPLLGVKHSYYVQNMRHKQQRNLYMHTHPVNSRCPWLWRICEVLSYLPLFLWLFQGPALVINTRGNKACWTSRWRWRFRILRVGKIHVLQ